jgi:hypothetical protein
MLCDVANAVREVDVQPQGSLLHGGTGTGLLDTRYYHECVVDTMVRAQFKAEERWWFDRSEEEAQLQHYLADEILDSLMGETVGVLDMLQAQAAQRVGMVS